jgi:autotransporter family porin
MQRHGKTYLAALLLIFAMACTSAPPPSEDAAVDGGVAAFAPDDEADGGKTKAPTETTSTTTEAPTATSTTVPAPTTTAPEVIAAAPTTAPPPPTTTTSPPAVPTVSGTGGSTAFLPPGAALPSDAACSAQVRSAGEVRALNATPNARAGRPALSGAYRNRVTGNFTGSTDEIIQWVACKWGLPTDVVRAQVTVESWGRQYNLGDWTSNGSHCPPGHPLGADGRAGQCPESLSLLQIKYRFHEDVFPAVEQSTAYGLDYAYAMWRSCYEGTQGWLNDVERGRDYAAGDAWGCVGRWYAGRWYTSAAQTYIDRVQSDLTGKRWQSPEFLGHG